MWRKCYYVTLVEISFCHERIDACNLRRRVCFTLIKQFMNSLKVAKQARATCCRTNSTFWATTSFACRLARSQPCLTSSFISGIRCCHQPWSKGKFSGPLLIPHRLWSRLSRWTDQATFRVNSYLLQGISCRFSVPMAPCWAETCYIKTKCYAQRAEL